MMKRIALALAIVPMLTVAASAVPLSGVQSITITDPDGFWFYIEELAIPNTASQDVASQAFGSTGTPNFVPQFGSTAVGAINDIFGNCCGTGTHSQFEVTVPPNNYTIGLPSPQNLEGLITIWNRQDGCCPERVMNYDIQFLNAAGAPITFGDGSNTLQVRPQFLTGDVNSAQGATIPIPQGIPEPGSLALAMIGLAGLVGGAVWQRRRK